LCSVHIFSRKTSCRMTLHSRTTRCIFNLVQGQAAVKPPALKKRRIMESEECTMYDLLFKPGKIGSLCLKNRIVMPAMGVSMAEPDGRANEHIIRYYEERAKGGCGLIITEITRVDEKYGWGLVFDRNWDRLTILN